MPSLCLLNAVLLLASAANSALALVFLPSHAPISLGTFPTPEVPRSAPITTAVPTDVYKHELLKREISVETFFLAPDNTCGWIGGVSYQSVTCAATTASCAFMYTAPDGGYIGCCDDASCVGIATNCYGSASSQGCDKACQDDTLLLKCYDPTAVMCVTASFLGGLKGFWCGSVGGVVDVETTYQGGPDRSFLELISTVSPSTILPSSSPLPTPSPTPTSSTTASATPTSSTTASATPTSSTTASAAPSHSSASTEVHASPSAPSVAPEPAAAASNSSSAPIGAIVGGVIGGLAVTGLVILAAICLCIRGKERNRPAFNGPPLVSHSPPYDSPPVAYPPLATGYSPPPMEYSNPPMAFAPPAQLDPAFDAAHRPVSLQPSMYAVSQASPPPDPHQMLSQAPAFSPPLSPAPPLYEAPNELSKASGFQDLHELHSGS